MFMVYTVTVINPRGSNTDLVVSNKNKTLNQSWINPLSTTMGQHLTNIKPTLCLPGAMVIVFVNDSHMALYLKCHTY